MYPPIAKMEASVFPIPQRHGSWLLANLQWKVLLGDWKLGRDRSHVSLLLTWPLAVIVAAEPGEPSSPARLGAVWGLFCFGGSVPERAVVVVVTQDRSSKQSGVSSGSQSSHLESLAYSRPGFWGQQWWVSQGSSRSSERGLPYAWKIWGRVCHHPQVCLRPFSGNGTQRSQEESEQQALLDFPTPSVHMRLLPFCPITFLHDCYCVLNLSFKINSFPLVLCDFISEAFHVR